MARYRYYPSGKLKTIIYPGGGDNGAGRVDYTYWPGGQLKQILDYLDSATVYRSTTYTWNVDGSSPRWNGVVLDFANGAVGTTINLPHGAARASPTMRTAT